MKILHIFNCKNGGFYDRIISCIRENDCFNENEHFFLLRNKERFDAIENKHNVILDLDNGSLVNKYENKFDFFFLHSLDSLEEPIQINKKIRCRIFWRTWGHDAGLDLKIRKNIFAYLHQLIKKIKLKHCIRDFYAIGVANNVDRIDMKKRYGKNITLYNFSYVSKETIDLSLRGNNLSNERAKILVGHSGFRNDLHFEVLKKMQNIRDKIEIFVPLVYGEEKYIKKVVEYIEQNFDIKYSHIIREKISYSNYCKLLSSINFAFLPSLKSYALGNLSICLNYSVNVITPKKSLIGCALAKENIPFIDYSTFNSNKDLSFASYSIDNTAFRLKTYDEKINEIMQLLSDIKENYGKQNRS